MKRKIIFCFILIFCLYPFFSVGQTNSSCVKTTEGTDFWVGFMESWNASSNKIVKIRMVSRFTCNYEIRIGSSNVVVKSGILLPDIPVEVSSFSLMLEEAIGSESIQDKAIHLTSNNPMNVYAGRVPVNSCAETTIFPTNALGNEYFAVSYTPNVVEAKQSNSEFLVVATEDKTTVTIVPNKVTDHLNQANKPITVSLNKGEVYQVQSMNHNPDDNGSFEGQGDLTGSYVSSNRPVALFSGSLATTVGEEYNSYMMNHLYEQVPPLQAWGNRFMAVPFNSWKEATYRVLAGYDNTTVRIGSDPAFTLKRGEFREFMLNSDDPRLIESSRPILLVEYGYSKTFAANIPFMTIVSPLSHTVQDAVFADYSAREAFLTVIAKDDAVSFITLDQNPLPFTSFPNTGYSYSLQSIRGSHRLHSSMPDKGFIAYVYNLGDYLNGTFGYGVGFNLNVQLDIGGGSNDTLYVCRGIEQKLEAGNYFSSYLWNTGATGSSILVSKEGWYSVTAKTPDGCVLSDSVFLKVDLAVFDPAFTQNYSETTTDHPDISFTNLTDGAVSYQWDFGDGETSFEVNPTHHFKDIGEYKVILRATSKFGCVDTASSVVKISPSVPIVQTGGPCHKTTEGTDFWFAFMETSYNSKDYGTYVEITMSSRFTCNYELRIGSSTEIVKSGTVFPDSPARVRLDWKLVESTGSEIVQDKAIHLTSNNPMNVYALNVDPYCSEATLIFPTNLLGKEYFAVSSAIETTGSGRNSQFMIVATEDRTMVTIVPNKVTELLSPANIPITVTLDKGQVYQVQSRNPDNAKIEGQGDLTGSYISSNRPVAFFSGSKDPHLFEEVPPVQAWGSRFMAVPLKTGQKDTYRVLAGYGNTIVKVGSNPAFTLQKGEFREFTLKYDDPRIVESSRPILLVQFSYSSVIDDKKLRLMLNVNPLSYTIQDVTFANFKTTNPYFLTLIAKDDAVSFITLDQNPVLFTSLPNSGYSYARVAITSDSHKLHTSMPDKGFSAYVLNSYTLTTHSPCNFGYGLGYNMEIQLYIGGNDTLYICPGTEQKLEAGSYFNSYLWNTGSTESSILVSKEGWYSVTARTFGGCEPSDKVYIKFYDPKINLGKDTGSCNPGEIILDAGKGFVSYLWQDGSASQTFQVLETGKYRVTGINEGGCPASDDINVTIFDPVFTPNYNVATTDHPDISFTNHTNLAVNYLWDFGDGETSVAKNPVHRYKESGEYKVILEATSEFGCADTVSSVVKIIPFNLFTPNAFRPDSEIPGNRIFLPIRDGADPDNYQLQVFNRVGATVFETKNPEIGWDGKMPNGTSAVSGVFVWIVKFVDVQGFDHIQKGTVILLR